MIFLMEQNIFLQEIFKIIFYLYQKYIKCFNGTDQIYSWKSNEMSEESIEKITKSNNRFAPTFVNHYISPDVSFMYI